jgi:hypothetical protein
MKFNAPRNDPIDFADKMKSGMSNAWLKRRAMLKSHRAKQS